MPLVDIEKQILKDAEATVKKIRFGNKEELEQLEKVKQNKLADQKKQIEQETRLEVEKVKREILVPARQKAKKALLTEKQRILSSLYADIQGEKKLSNAEVAKVREATEVMTAELLFKKEA